MYIKLHSLFAQLCIVDMKMTHIQVGCKSTYIVAHIRVGSGVHMNGILHYCSAASAV